MQGPQKCGPCIAFAIASNSPAGYLLFMPNLPAAPLTRRHVLQTAVLQTALSAGALGIVSALAPRAAAAAGATQPGFQVHRWKRDEKNPVLPPGPAPFDVACC